MRRVLDTLYRAAGGLAALFILAIVVLVFAQVGLNLADKITVGLTGKGLGVTIPSYADFTGFFLAAASFLALAYTLRAGGTFACRWSRKRWESAAATRWRLWSPRSAWACRALPRGT